MQICRILTYKFLIHGYKDYYWQYIDELDMPYSSNSMGLKVISTYINPSACNIIKLIWH